MTWCWESLLKIYSIHHPSLVHSTGHLATESSEVGHNDLPFINLCWLFQMTLFVLHMFRKLLLGVFAP